MNKPLLAAFALTALLASAPWTPQALAGTGIQRCQAPDGATVYTDKACAVFGSRAVPMSGELLTRIVREEARDEALAGSSVDAGSNPNLDFAGFVDAQTSLASTTSSSAAGRRSASGGCARTPTQLAMDLRGAFVLGDVNRIAESYHWVGMSSKGAVRVMERLDSLARHQINDTQYYDAQISSGDGTGMGALVATASSVGGSGGVLQVTFGDDGRTTTSVTDFDVEHYADCYFVRF